MSLFALAFLLMLDVMIIAMTRLTAPTKPDHTNRWKSQKPRKYSEERAQGFPELESVLESSKKGPELSQKKIDQNKTPMKNTHTTPKRTRLLPSTPVRKRKKQIETAKAHALGLSWRRKVGEALRNRSDLLRRNEGGLEWRLGLSKLSSLKISKLGQATDI